MLRSAWPEVAEAEGGSTAAITGRSPVITSMRTTGSVVDKGHVRRLRGLPGSGVTARCQAGCCTIVLHVGVLTPKCQLVGPLRPGAKFSGALPES